MTTNIDNLDRVKENLNEKLLGTKNELEQITDKYNNLNLMYTDLDKEYINYKDDNIKKLNITITQFKELSDE